MEGEETLSSSGRAFANSDTTVPIKTGFNGRLRKAAG